MAGNTSVRARRVPRRRRERQGGALASVGKAEARRDLAPSLVRAAARELTRLPFPPTPAIPSFRIESLDRRRGHVHLTQRVRVVR
jgi:hypothetical protein